MAQDKLYLGIPRERIPWFPSIDVDKCVGCFECVDFCQHGVYEADGEGNRARVARPFECVVYCNKCRDRCEAGAISFPDREAVDAMIARLREEYRAS